MKRIPSGLVFLVLTLPLIQGAGATAAASPDTDKPLDTVLVEGTRAQLNEMLHEMVLSEDRFFKRYNELNAKDDFDMMCFEEARVGTHFKRRYCLVAYMDMALQKEGQDQASFLRDLYIGAQDGTPTYGSNFPPPMRGLPPPPAIIMIEARRKEFKQNMRDVVARNPELVDMLRERYELGKRYEATRRKVWGLKPPPEEKDTGLSVPIPP